ncbi:hypothetical protein [Terasakiispira papahanaumokuakeensis]|nr:hypothetical protein [Terasakiispira papahanaumokuakeensis]
MKRLSSQSHDIAGLGDNAPLTPGQMVTEHNADEPSTRSEKQARERERLAWEDEERRRKIEERRKAEQERLEAERRALYTELEGIDFDLLALNEYPTDYEVESARRSRVIWFIGLGGAVFLFLASLLSLVGPWLGGIAGGIAFVLWLTHGSGMLSLFPSLTLYTELIAKRKKLKRELIEYIRNIEGRQGFIHRIYPLARYNARLGARKFRRLALMSKEHTLLSNLRTLQDTANYHEYLVEALKGYQELLQQEKEDAFVESMDFDPDLLSDEDAARLRQVSSAEEEEAAKPDPTLFVTEDEHSPTAQDDSADKDQEIR